MSTFKSAISTSIDGLTIKSLWKALKKEFQRKM